MNVMLRKKILVGAAVATAAWAIAGSAEASCKQGFCTSGSELGNGWHHVEFTTRLAPNLPLVYGDPIALRRILENLMANAVESLESKPGRVTISTEVVERTPDAAVRVAVTDSGRGMSADEAGKIFNDFYTTKEGGTGLGLSIVRRLVMDLHGTLGVESVPGKGTRITVEIPAKTSART